MSDADAWTALQEFITNYCYPGGANSAALGPQAVNTIMTIVSYFASQQLGLSSGQAGYVPVNSWINPAPGQPGYVPLGTNPYTGSPF